MFHAQLFATQAWSVTSGPHPQLRLALCADRVKSVQSSAVSQRTGRVEAMHA